VTHKTAAHGDATARHRYCGSLLFVATVVPPFVFPPCLPLSFLPLRHLPFFVTTLPFPILAVSFLTFHSSLFLYIWHRLQFNIYQFARMALLEEFFTINILNQFGA